VTPAFHPTTVASALRPLVEGPTPDRAAIDAFLATHTFPLVQGGSCTFVYRGEADRVMLRHWIFALPATQALDRLSGTDLWILTMDLPDCSRVEYKYEIVRGQDHQLVEDPLNPQRARDPFGANSVVHGAGYEVPEWTRFDPEARPGTLQDFSLHSRELPGERRVTVYLPARFRKTRRYPLLVVHDGGDYVQYAGLKTVLDNLIHRLEIPEMIVALSHPDQRLVEYAGNPAHGRYLTGELLPKLAGLYPLIDDPAERGLMGASFGAVASLATAWEHPGIYGRLLLQSGSFAFTDIGQHHRGPLFDPVVRFMNAFRAEPRRISDQVFVSCGIYESLIYENRSLIPFLQSSGMKVRFVESRDGHNWENWRDRLREGLSWLFPGPQWMVYE
jgi:enterochelin esterase-like enzyme